MPQPSRPPSLDRLGLWVPRVSQDPMGHRVCKVPPDLRAVQAHRDHKVSPALPGLRVNRGVTALPGRSGPSALKVLQDLQEAQIRAYHRKDSLVLQDRLGRKDRSARRVPKARKDLPGTKVPKDLKVFRDREASPALWALQESRDLLGPSEPWALSGRWGLQDLPDRKVLPVRSAPSDLLAPLALSALRV